MVVRRNELSDAELLASVARAPDRFAAFYDRYETAIVGYFLRRTGDPELAADLTAEVFAAALRAAGRYRAETSTAAPWLFTIAQHTLARSVRRGRVEARARRRLGIRDAFELEGEQATDIHGVVAGEQWVAEVLAGLPADQQDAIRSRILDDLPYPEIAKTLETSELVIRKRVSRGLAALRERLEESP